MGSSSMWMTLLLPALLVVAMSAETLTVKPGCVDRCGNVSIPYPFGIGKDCFREGFEISCGSDSVPVLVGTGHTGAKPVLVTAPRGPGDATGGVYRISRNLNELVVLGCNTLGLLASGCLTRSTRHAWPSSMTSAPCRKAHAGASAAAGCSVDLPMGLTNNLVKMAPVGSGQLDVCPCDYAFIVDKGHYNFSKADLHMNGSQTSMPLSLDWAIRDNGKTCADAATQPGYACKSVHSECVNTNNGPGYTCNCTKGYEGNPCDVDNGCTGGFGEVYKGLIDGVWVAVKKPISGNQMEPNQFANEVIIQSKVIHKNIVRLIGCCLEVDTPMLVFEFISQGSMDDILHGGEKKPLGLDAQINISAASAHGLACMHSQANTVILHGDVKPANILLDDNFMPKISDFGISRLIARDNEHAALVIGDMTYMDPVYMQSGLLTEKNDVYSFGVVILELISRKKATDPGNSSLVNRFLENHKKGKKSTELFDMEIAEGSEDLLQSLTELSIKCLDLEVDQRPTMSEVAEQLVAFTRSHQV
ncbi:hypothetical protein ACQ4PT_037561 [Festuca glaucescens]